MPIDPNLSPPDAVVALRSLPRRYETLFAGIDDSERPDDLAQIPATDGWTAIGHVVAASRAIGLAARALEEVLRTDDPSIDRQVVERSRRVEDPAPGGSIDERVSELGWEADALADAADGVAPADWARSGSLAGTGRPVSALDLLRAAVEAGVEHLRLAEETLTEVENRRW